VGERGTSSEVSDGLNMCEVLEPRCCSTYVGVRTTNERPPACRISFLIRSLLKSESNHRQRCMSRDESIAQPQKNAYRYRYGLSISARRRHHIKWARGQLCGWKTGDGVGIVHARAHRGRAASDDEGSGDSRTQVRQDYCSKAKSLSAKRPAWTSYESLVTVLSAARGGL
jgi:hypothetical protein